MIFQAKVMKATAVAALAAMVVVTAGLVPEALRDEAKTPKTTGSKAAPPPDELLETLEGKEHPFLLFTDITDTPGWRNRTKAPWSGYEAGIVSAGNAALSIDFSTDDGSDRDSTRAQHAQNLGLAYQVTGQNNYADKAKEALLNMRTCGSGTGPPKTVKVWAIHGYSLAYDWVQPTLDEESDESIRDQLAQYAAEMYTDLNDGGTNPGYVSFADYHGQAYPVMGIVGCVLHDYTNPNNLPSVPADWLMVATEYLFENDQLHNHNCSLMSHTFDETGFCLMGGYRAYVIDEFLWWFSAYSHSFGRNIFEDYPISKLTTLADLWATLPGRYQSNYETQSQKHYTYVRGVMQLLGEEYRAYMLKYLGDFNSILPHAYSYGAQNQLLYLVLEDYTDAEKEAPAWTSFFHPEGQFQVFRNNWEADSDWMSLVTWNWETGSNRNMAHHDQLGFEYYSRGDLLLADGGETKHILNTLRYSQFDHNCLWIEDPRNPFDGELSGILGVEYKTHARPVFKGLASGIVTPAAVGQIIRTGGLEFLEAGVTINYVLGNSWTQKQALTSPISYTRAVLYVRDGYFIVLDGLEGSQPWTFSNALRFTSLNITPTVNGGDLESDVGHVNGELALGETTYDWLSRPYMTEHATGIQTASVNWETTNPYGQNVALHVYSIPTPEIVALKHTTRVAGSAAPAEVFYPMLRLRTPEPVEKVHWMTALVSRYESEDEREVSQVQVTGDGSALKLILGAVTDWVGFGKGQLEYGDTSTDAEVSLVRDNGGKVELALLVRGRSLSYKGGNLISAASQIPHAALCFSDEKITGHVNLEEAMTVSVLCGFTPKAVTYKADPEDGFVWSQPGEPVSLPFEKQGDVLNIQFPQGAGSIVVKAPSLAGRYIFYNNSSFDESSDDDAIATDKTALLPGGTATFDNYTSYSRGINGIMIDIANLPGTPTAADFTFKVGNDDTPGSWADAPDPAGITIREGAGIDGSDRITVIWADKAIWKQWLQVTVKDTIATGLVVPDVFYFGNAVGDSGNSADNAVVNTMDEMRARYDPYKTPQNPAVIENHHDYNRNGVVNTMDELIARTHNTTPQKALDLITAP